MAATSPDPLAELIAVGKSYWRGRTRHAALADVTLTVRAGAYLAITGPSGSGKTTCLNLLGCLDVPTSGTCRIGGKATDMLDPVARACLRRDHIGFVFQGFNLIARSDALENVALPLLYRGVARVERTERAAAALAQVGLADWRGSLPGELSGGQQQRVAIARAIVAEPRLLIADEPTGALDVVTGGEIITLLEDLNARLGIALVVVTHDAGLARRAARRIGLARGRMVEDTGHRAPMEPRDAAA